MNLDMLSRKKFRTSVFMLTALFGLILLACEKLDDLTKFQMDYTTEMSIASTSVLNSPIEFFSPDIETNAESQFAINDTRKDLIEELTLTQLTLTLKSPSNSDFSFLKSVEIFIEADGLKEIRVAYITDIPSDSKFLELITESTDLQEYIKKDEFQLKAKIITDEFTSQNHVIDIYSLFDVDAKVLGQ